MQQHQLHRFAITPMIMRRLPALGDKKDVILA